MKRYHPIAYESVLGLKVDFEESEDGSWVRFEDTENVIFTVSNDGGKTGIFWRERAMDCIQFLKDIPNDALKDYCVVAVERNKN